MKGSFNLLIFVVAVAMLGCDEANQENLAVEPAFSVKDKNGEIQEYYLYNIKTTSSPRAFDRSGELSKSEVEQLYNDFSSETSFHRTIHLKPYSENLSDTTTSIRMYSKDSIHFRSPFAVSGPMWDTTPTNIYYLETDGNNWTFTSKDTMVYTGLDEHSATFQMAKIIRKYPFAYSDGSSFQERFFAEKCDDDIKFRVLKFVYIYLVYEVDQGFWFNRFRGSISPSNIPENDTVMIQEWEHTFRKKKN